MLVVFLFCAYLFIWGFTREIFSILTPLLNNTVLTILFGILLSLFLLFLMFHYIIKKIDYNSAAREKIKTLEETLQRQAATIISLEIEIQTARNAAAGQPSPDELQNTISQQQAQLTRLEAENRALRERTSAPAEDVPLEPPP